MKLHELPTDHRLRNVAPLKRGEVAAIAKAVKKYKLKNDITIHNRKQRRNTQ